MQRNRSVLSRTLVAATLLAVTTCVALPLKAEGNPAPSRKAKAGGSETIKSVLEVVAVDDKARRLSLKRDDGNTLTVIAGPAVKNLGQIRSGDFVVAEYGRAQAISLQKTAAADAAANGQAPGKGKAPAAAVPYRNIRSIVADIIAIDDKKGFATLKGAKDNIIDVVVSDRKALASVKIGDQVRLDYTDAVAVSLRPARSRH